MPKEPMKSRVVRVPDKLWAAAQKRADESSETVSEAVRNFLYVYVRNPMYEEVWACEKPPADCWYQVVRDHWDEDYTVRTIYEIRDVERR